MMNLLLGEIIIAAGSSAADQSHDLDFIPFEKPSQFVLRPWHHIAIHLDGESLRILPEHANKLAHRERCGKRSAFTINDVARHDCGPANTNEPPDTPARGGILSVANASRNGSQAIDLLK